VAQGYVGEVITNRQDITSFTGSSNTWENVTSIPLTKGNFIVSGQFHSAIASVTTHTDFEGAISGYTTTTTTDQLISLNQVNGVAPSTSAQDGNYTIPCVPVRCDGTNIYIAGFTVTGTTLYLKARVGWSGGTGKPARGGTITAIRIA
jgi:hypothetical protein